MSDTITIGLLGFALAMVVNAVVVARWTATIQTMVTRHDQDILSLRTSRHSHGEDIVVLKREMEIVGDRLDKLGEA